MIHRQSAVSEVEQQLQNLRIFLSVASTGSVTRAARQLFKSPSAITRSTLQLEECLGVPLFDRKPRGMSLNSFGEAVLTRVRRIQDEIRLATTEYSRSNPHKAGGSSATAVANLLFDGNRLGLLLNLATSRNTVATAASMNLTRAGVGMALARIEASLGRSLFLRTMKGMVPTVETEQLLVHARRIFAELRHMSSDLSALSGTLTGSVVIGTTPLGRSNLVPTAIAAAVSLHPGLRVITEEGSHEDLIRSLREGDIDMVIGVLRPRQLYQGLAAEALFMDQLGVVVRASHPLARRRKLHLSDLTGRKWIHASLGRRSLVDASFRELGLEPPNPCVETRDVAILKQLLIETDMMALTSPRHLSFEIRAGLLKVLPLALAATRLEVGLIVRDGAMLSPAANVLVDAVRRHKSDSPPPHHNL